VVPQPLEVPAWRANPFVISGRLSRYIPRILSLRYIEIATKGGSCPRGRIVKVRIHMPALGRGEEPGRSRAVFLTASIIVLVVSSPPAAPPPLPCRIRQGVGNTLQSGVYPVLWRGGQ